MWGGDTGGGHPPPLREAQTYRVSLPKQLPRLWCPVAGCLGGASSRTNLWIHFTHRIVRDIILILEEGNHPYPRCPQCDMFVPQNPFNGQNLVTSLCRRGVESKWRYLEEEDAREGMQRALTVYGSPLSQVTSFMYLGRFLAAEDDNWPAMVRNLRRARHK